MMIMVMVAGEGKEGTKGRRRRGRERGGVCM